MTGGELVAISRLLKMTGKVVKGIINSDEGQMVISDVKKGAKVVANSAIKPAAQKGKELYSDHVVATYMKQLKKKVDLLMALESRSEEEDGIIISDEEIKTLITMCDNPAIIDDVLLKYLLMMLAVKSRGMVNYIKDITETRTYIDMLFTDLVDESILNAKTVDEISQAIRLWITFVINNALDKLEEYEEEKRVLKEEQIKAKEENTKQKEKTNQFEKKEPIKKDEQREIRKELSPKEMFMIIGTIVGILIFFNI